jgi:hypothetical protein
MSEAPDEDPIPGLMRRIQDSCHEDTIAWARDEMYDYKAYALARPVQEHVDFLRVKLKTKLLGIIAAAERAGVEID